MDFLRRGTLVFSDFVYNFSNGISFHRADL